MLKEITEFKTKLEHIVNYCLQHTFGNSWKFELDNIDFDIEYVDPDSTTSKTIIDIIYIKGRFGDGNKAETWKSIDIPLFTDDEFNLDDDQFIYGVCFGYFQSMEDNT